MIPASEVEAIIAATVERQVKAALEKAMSNQAPQSEMAEFTEKLAMAINSVNDQGKSQKPVAPEELARRNKARVAMEELIERTYERGVQPMYKLTAKVYLGEQLIQPVEIDQGTKRAIPQQIGWFGVPNQHMDPLNEEAENIMALFLQSIGGKKLKAAAIRVTPGGLVVRSGGMPVEGGRGPAPRVGRDDAGYRDQPAFRGRAQGGIHAETRILGTVMPAARHSAPLF